MKIGDLVISNPVIMAPMAGVTDFPYRQILRKIGCQLLFTEMVSSKGLVYENDRTEELLEFFRYEDGYIGVQLFGEEAEIMAEAARLVERNFKPDIIDINMGCPTPKIVKNGSGAALMKEPGLAGEIIAGIAEAVALPVTVKIRKGWDEERVNAVKIATVAERNGAKAITVHGRTREQFYTGRADWNIIRKVKEMVNIPVIGNGDVFSPEAAAKMLDLTGCDGIMVARGARGNPWLLKRTAHLLNTGELLPEPDYKDTIQMALYHLEKSVQYYGRDIAVPKMRKHLSWYIKGMPYSSSIKDRLNKLSDTDDIRGVLEGYLAQLLAYKSG